jgi:hypothetical protein
MQQDDGVSVAVQGTDAPCAKRCAVGSGNGHFLEFGVITRSDSLGVSFSRWSQCAPARVERHFASNKANGGAGGKPDSNKDRAPKHQFEHSFHDVQFYAAGLTCVPRPLHPRSLERLQKSKKLSKIIPSALLLSLFQRRYPQ